MPAFFCCLAACDPAESELPAQHERAEMMHPCTTRPVVDVSYLLPPFADDVSVELADAISDAASNGFAAGLPAGTWRLSQPLRMPDGGHLVGVGPDTHLIASVEPGAWHPDDAMVELVGVDRVHVCGVMLDHQGELRHGNDQQLSFTMLMSNTSDDVVDGVVFRNPGSPSASAHRPSGPALLMIARDACVGPAKDCDEPYIEHHEVGEPGSVTHTIVRNSSFLLDDDTTIAFAIRMYTDFERKRDPGSFTGHVAHNEITNNGFEGNFAWNSIELAGGGTVSNTVLGNEFSGFGLSHIDFDKGASFNVAQKNLVTRSGRSPIPYDSPDTKYRAMHPYAITDHGSDDTYRNRGNRVADNIIESMVQTEPGDVVPSGGILVTHTTLSEVTGNQIYDLYGGARGYGISIAGDVDHLEVARNVIGLEGSVFAGIWLTPWSPPMGSPIVFGVNDATIENNVVRSTQAAFSAGTLESASWFWNLWIRANSFETTSPGHTTMFLATVASVITDNDTFGGRNGIQLESPGAIVQRNRFHDSERFSLQISADAWIEDNEPHGPGAAALDPDTVGLDDCFPHCMLFGTPSVVQAGNSFACPPVPAVCP